MTRQWAKHRSACLTIVLATAGCGTTHNRQSEPSLRPSPSSKTASQPSKDLPPEKAAQVCFTVATELARKGYETEAIEQYEKAGKLDPRNAEVAHRLAVLFDRQGNVVRAQTEYHRALEVSPNNPDLLNDMGYFAYERSNWTEAESWLRKALAANPKHDRACVNLGMALAQQGKVEEALATFSKVVTPAQAQANVGMILAQRGRIQDARKAFKESLNHDPDSKVVHAALAALERTSPAKGDSSFTAASTVK